MIVVLGLCHSSHPITCCAMSWILCVQIIRDTAGVPEVLTRLDPGPLPIVEPVTEYES